MPLKPCLRRIRPVFRPAPRVGFHAAPHSVSDMTDLSSQTTCGARLLRLNNKDLYKDIMDRPIYNRVALFRNEAGLSRKELAERVGVHPQTIGFLERGDYKPSLSLAMRIAELFAVPVDMLFSFHPFEAVATSLLRARENRHD